MNVPSLPRVAITIVPSLTSRLRYGSRSGPWVSRELHRICREHRFDVSPNQVQAYVGACDRLLSTSDRVVLEFGKRRIEYFIRQQRPGQICLARLDLVLFPQPRDYRGDPFIPGARHRLDYVRIRIQERALETGCGAIEWWPTGEIRELAP